MNEKKFCIKDALKNPVVFLAAAYPYLIVIVVILGLAYIWNLNNVYGNKQVPFLVDSTALFTDLTTKPPMIAAAVDLNTISNPLPDMLTAGKNLYTKSCETCHGASGLGDGPGGVALNPPPRNFTSPDAWKNGYTVTGIYKTLQEGLKGSGMVAFDVLTPQERINLIHYIRAFLKTPPPPASPDEIKELDLAYQLSKGKQVPGQISIIAAAKLFQDSLANRFTLEDNVLSKLSVLNDSSAGASLFTSVTTDKRRAVSSFVNTQNWQDNDTLFQNIILNYGIRNGFNGKVYSLTADEFRSLREFLKSIIPS